MCMPVIDLNLGDIGELTEEQKKAIAAQAGTTTTPGVGDTMNGKTTGGQVSEAGNPGASGGDTPLQQLQNQQQVALADAQGQNNMLMDLLAQQAAASQAATAGVLQGQQAAADALKQGFLSLTDMQKQAMEAAEALRKNTGQASRKPNYSVSLKANKAKNKAGVSSTMLTGAGGIATSALPLGRAALLGGA